MKPAALTIQNPKLSYGASPLLAAFGLGLVALSAVACQQTAETPQPSGDPEQPDVSSQTVGENTPIAGENTPIADEEQPSGIDLRQTWQSGPHADTFVLTDSGANSSCARCHAPVNWIPSMDDIPESCLTCKFEIDPPPPRIPEEDWLHIECIVCHRVDKDEVEPEYAWLAIAPIEEYEEVASSTELCLKCHAGDSVADHPAIVLAGAHQAMTCSECHDSHDGTASCADSSCHVDAEDPPAGHDSEHEAIACVACHDSGQLTVSPLPEDEIWTSWISAESGDLIRPYSSHNTILEAPCDRCHFPENPWGLSESVESEG